MLVALMGLSAGCDFRSEPEREAGPPIGPEPVSTVSRPIAQEVPVSRLLEATAEANTGLALALYGELRRLPGNLFFSPYSICSALAMAAEGARGDTAEEMGRALRFPEAWRRQGSDALQQPWRADYFLAGLSALNQALAPKDPTALAALEQDIAELRRAHERASARARQLREERNWDAQIEAAQVEEGILAKLNAALVQVNPYDLRVANGVWCEGTYPFHQDFLRTINRYSPGAVQPADFLHQFPVERKKINEWVAHHTRDRIVNIIPELPPEVGRRMRLILVNAIYFKGQWAEPFLEAQTRPRDFFAGQGRKSRVPMMYADRLEAGRYGAFHPDGSFFDTPRMIDPGQTTGLYPESAGFAILELPYQGERLSMVVMAPLSPDGLGALESQLTPTNLAGWLGRLAARDVEVFLPRFRLETDYRLHEVLPAVGMKRAFVDPSLPQGADFSGMSTSRDPSDGLFISQVLHKAFVEVAEKGTEAAAATAIMMPGATAVPVQIPFTPVFKADRPFLFLIRDRETGVLLFLGRMTQPA